VTIRVGGHDVVTLRDILPAEGPMKMLMIAKTPTLTSVDAGHYFQGREGRMFWNRLSDHGLLNVLPPTFEDDALLDHGYGLTKSRVTTATSRRMTSIAMAYSASWTWWKS